MLEWVSNTTPLKSVISEEMGRDAAFCAANSRAVEEGEGEGEDAQREVDLMRLPAYEQRLKWVKSHDYKDYHRMFKTATRPQATALYQTLTAQLPSDFIRRRFLALAVTAEAFLTVRAEFARTLAVSSIFGYILGKFSACIWLGVSQAVSFICYSFFQELVIAIWRICWWRPQPVP